MTIKYKLDNELDIILLVSFIYDLDFFALTFLAKKLILKFGASMHLKFLNNEALAQLEKVENLCHFGFKNGKIGF